MKESNNKTYKVLPGPITDEIIEQIKMVRDTGETNMLDTITVRELAYEMDQMALVEYLSDRENRNAYFEFILHGKRSQNK